MLLVHEVDISEETILAQNKSDLSARIVKLNFNSTTMIEHYLNRRKSSYDETKCFKQLILVIFDSEWTVIQTMQLILLIISTNLLILYIIFVVNYFVKTLKIMSNRKRRIKILIDIVKKIDSLWINTCINGNVLSDDLKSILRNLCLRLYINSNDDCCCDYLIGILYKVYFRNNGMYCSVIRMVMRKRMRKKKIIIAPKAIATAILCARISIVL